MHYPHTHHYDRKGKYPRFDKLVTIMAVVGPMFSIPQTVDIFVKHSAAGVSLVSWVGFAVYTMVFLTYGILYRLRPVIIAQSLWLCGFLSVIVGVILYG